MIKSDCPQRIHCGSDSHGDLLPVKLCPQFLYFTVQLSLLHASAQSYEFISADAEQV